MMSRIAITASDTRHSMHAAGGCAKRPAGCVWLAVAACVSLVLSMGALAPNSFADSRVKGPYGKVLVVPLMTDALRARESDGSKTRDLPATDMGWGTRDTAVTMVADAMFQFPTKVVGVTDAAQLFTDEEKQKEERDWPSMVFERLRQNNRIGDAEAVLLFRENAIDQYGREYSAFRDFLGTGVVGAIVGSSMKDELYQPTYMLALNVGFQETMVGPSRCMIGFDAQLLDATGHAISKRRSFLGSYMVPPGLQIDTLSNLSPDVMRDLKERCSYALRKAVDDALLSVGLTWRSP